MVGESNPSNIQAITSLNDGAAGGQEAVTQPTVFGAAVPLSGQICLLAEIHGEWAGLPCHVL